MGYRVIELSRYRVKARNNKGLILIVSLWIVAILALLAVGLARRVSIELYLIKFSRDWARARFTAEAASQLAVRVISQDINDYDSLNETWSTGIVFGSEESIFKDVELREGIFTVKHKVGQEDENQHFLYGLSDEDSKLNINTATVVLLESFFLELEIDNAREISASILDWIDADDFTSFDGAENGYYSGLDVSYQCKNAPLSVVEELGLIKGMDEEKFMKIKPFVTVYGDGKININTVSEVVLSSLLISRRTLDSTARELASQVIAYRRGEDGEIGTEDDGRLVKFEDIVFALSTSLSLGEFAKCADVIKFKSDFFRADIFAYSANKVAQKKVSCILKKDPLAIDMSELVYWQEQ